MSYKNMKRILLILLSGFLSIMMSSCTKPSSKLSQMIENQDEIPEFDVAEVRYHSIIRDVEGLGNLIYFDKATVISRIDGVIEHIFIKKGENVTKGDRILQLTNYQLELEKIMIEKEILEAEEELETAHTECILEERSLYKKFFEIEKMELEIEKFKGEIDFLHAHVRRKKVLFEKGGISEEELRNLEFSLESKKMELGILKKEYEVKSYGFSDKDILEEGYQVPADEEERRRLLVYINTKLARKRMEFAEIRLKKIHIEKDRINWLLSHRIIESPISGTVAEILKYVGERVTTDEAIATVLNHDSLIARVSFSETDLPKLQEGREALVYIDSLQKEIKGNIYTIDPYIDVNTRTFSVDCEIKNTLGLVPGMFVKVRIPTQRSVEILLVPRNAFIRETENKGCVYLITDEHRIFRKEIDYEGYDDDFIIVTEGLREGDIVVKNAFMNLLDGMEISIRDN